MNCPNCEENGMTMYVNIDGKLDLRFVDYVDNTYSPSRYFPELRDGEEVAWLIGSPVPMIIKVA